VRQYDHLQELYRMHGQQNIKNIQHNYIT